MSNPCMNPCTECRLIQGYIHLLVHLHRQGFFKILSIGPHVAPTSNFTVSEFYGEEPGMRL